MKRAFQTVAEAARDATSSMRTLATLITPVEIDAETRFIVHAGTHHAASAALRDQGIVVADQRQIVYAVPIGAHRLRGLRRQPTDHFVSGWCNPSINMDEVDECLRVGGFL